MKNTLIAIFSLGFLLSSAALANEPDKDTISSVVMLSSQEGNQCASGFIADNLIFTNAHVAEFLCPYKDCSGVSVRKAPAIGAEPSIVLPYNKMKIVFMSRALDFSVLQFDAERISPALTVLQSTPDFSQSPKEVYVLGFPRCQRLTLEQGKVSEVNRLHIYSSAGAAHGSSGSPLLNERFEVIGIVDQASSIKDALYSLVSGGRFSNRAIRSDVIAGLLGYSEREKRYLETSRLINLYYEQRILPSGGGMPRLRKSFDFFPLARGLRKDLLAEDGAYSSVDVSDALFALHFFGEYPGWIAEAKKIKSTKNFYLELERLVFNYNLEIKGPYREIFSELEPVKFQQGLENSNRPSGHIATIIESLQKFLASGYQGLEISMVFYGFLFFALFCLLLFIWSFSTGYVFSAARGGIIRKVFVSALVALALWPISFLIFLFAARRD